MHPSTDVHIYTKTYLHQTNGHYQDVTWVSYFPHWSQGVQNFAMARCPSCHPTNSVKSLK